MDIINESLGNRVTKIKTAPLVTGDYSPAFALDLMLKDIHWQQEADFPLGDAAVASYKQAQQDGLGKADVIRNY